MDLERIETRLKKMDDRALEFAQVRSNFQIEKFIGMEEYTPITRFRHLSHNSYVALQEVRRLTIDKERSERKINKLSMEKTPDYDLDILEESRKLTDIDIRLKGLLSEIDYIEMLCDKLEAEEIEKTGEGFTNEKLQEQEAEYWHKRLSSQMHANQIGNSSGVGSGNYKAMIQSCCEGITNENITDPIQLDVNSLAVRTLSESNILKNTYLLSNS